MSNESKALGRLGGVLTGAIAMGWISDDEAAELRRQHTALQDLQTECAALRAQLEQKSERIAHLEATASSNYGRGHADAHQMAAQGEPVEVTDQMAYAFHNAIGDGSLGSDEVEDLKTGLRAAFAHITHPQQAREPMTDARIYEGVFQLTPQGARYWKTEVQAFREGARFAERHHNIKGKQ
jgi:hypothetical protein